MTKNVKLVLGGLIATILVIGFVVLGGGSTANKKVEELISESLERNIPDPFVLSYSNIECNIIGDKCTIENVEFTERGNDRDKILIDNIVLENIKGLSDLGDVSKKSLRIKDGTITANGFQYFNNGELQSEVEYISLFIDASIKMNNETISEFDGLLKITSQDRGIKSSISVDFQSEIENFEASIIRSIGIKLDNSLIDNVYSFYESIIEKIDPTQIEDFNQSYFDISDAQKISKEQVDSILKLQLATILNAAALDTFEAIIGKDNFSTLSAYLLDGKDDLEISLINKNNENISSISVIMQTKLMAAIQGQEIDLSKYIDLIIK